MSEAKKVGYVFQASSQINESTSISISGNFAEHAETKEMVTEMNKVLNALEIQRTTRMKIPAVMGALKDQEAALERNIESIEKLKFKQQEGKLTSAERAQLENGTTQMQRIKDQVEDGRKILAELEKEVE